MLVKDSVNLSVRRAGVMWELCVFSFFIFLIIIIMFFLLKEFRSQLFPVRLKL